MGAPLSPRVDPVVGSCGGVVGAGPEQGGAIFEFELAAVCVDLHTMLLNDGLGAGEGAGWEGERLGEF